MLEIEAAEQTKNFLSFIFRLSAGGQGGAAKKWKEIFGFATRESASASEARITTQSERTWRVQATTHAERAKSLVFSFKISSRK